MNVLFTNFCNLRCPYCFAKDKLVSNKNRFKSYIKLEDLEIVTNFLKRSHVKRIGVVGGEPTLHPEFKKAMKLLQDNQIDISIFSNGIIKKTILEFLKNNKKNGGLY